MLLDENGLGDYGTNASRTQESDKSSDDMDEKDDEIAHLLIVTKPGIAWGCASNYQFARDTCANCIFCNIVWEQDPPYDRPLALADRSELT